MMKFKKVLAAAMTGVMMLGTAATAIAVSPSVSTYAAVTATVLTVDVSTYEATIEAKNNEPYVCLQVLKENKADSKVTAEYWYPVNSEKKAVVDLSFLKATKAQYIRAYGVADSASDIVEIKAQPKTTIKYDSKTQKFIDSKTKSELEAADLQSLEYRTLYSSSWGKVSSSAYVTNKLATFDVSMATVAGTTLVIRKAADTDTPAGTEVKVKIAAAAKAPKVKIDYVKGTITLPKGAEAAVLGTAALTDASYTTATGKVEAAALLQTLGVAADAVDAKVKAGYTLVVRTAATDKKAASNLAFVVVNASPVIADSNKTISDGETTASTLTYAMTDKGITLTPGTSNTRTYAYSTDGGKKWTTVNGAVTVELEDKAKIKVYIPAVKEDTKTATAGAFASNVLEVTYAKPSN